MIKGSIQEDVTAVNIYASNIGAPKYIKQILTDKGRNRQSHFVDEITLNTHTHMLAIMKVKTSQSSF